jgi:hypothetical protein
MKFYNSCKFKKLESFSWWSKAEVKNLVKHKYVTYVLCVNMAGELSSGPSFY